MGFLNGNNYDGFNFEDECNISFSKQKRNEFLNSLKVEKPIKPKNIIDDDKVFLDLFN